jgi:16S rRNA processing protein RimM
MPMRRARSSGLNAASLAGSRSPNRVGREASEGTRVCVAQIGAPHGLRGEVRLRAFTEDPMSVNRYGPLDVEDASRTLEIEALRPAGDALVARFAGIADRDAAAGLRNIKLYVPRARLPNPEAETYYHGDLIGLAVVDADGTAVGTVRAVQNFGAGDLLEIAPPEGAATFLLPFTKTFVPAIDVAGGRIVIDAAGVEAYPGARKPSPRAGEGGERTQSASRVRGQGAQPLTPSSPPTRTTLSRKGRG